MESLPKLDLAALRLRDAVRFVLDAERPAVGLRAAIFEAIAREQLEEDVATICEISRGQDEIRYFDQLIDHYSHMRRFLPMLLRMIRFQSHVPGDPVIEALDFLRRREGKREVPMEKAPLRVVTKNWHKLVLSDDVPDSRFYTLCTLERLQDGLHRRDIFLPKSERWGDPRAKLLQGESWQQARSNVCRILNRQADGEKEVKDLAAQLDAAYRRRMVKISKCAEESRSSMMDIEDEHNHMCAAFGLRYRIGQPGTPAAE